MRSFSFQPKGKTKTVTSFVHVKLNFRQQQIVLGGCCGSGDDDGDGEIPPPPPTSQNLQTK